MKTIHSARSTKPITIVKKKSLSLSSNCIKYRVQMGTLSRSNSNLEMVVFEEMEKTGVPGEEPRSKDENEQQTMKAESKLSHVGGRQMLSPLCHMILREFGDKNALIKWKSVNFSSFHSGGENWKRFKVVQIVKRAFCRTDRFQNWVNCAKIIKTHDKLTCYFVLPNDRKDD